MPGNDLLSHNVVPSALERFTVEFGMGSSGGVPQESPGKRRMFWIAQCVAATVMAGLDPAIHGCFSTWIPACAEMTANAARLRMIWISFRHLTFEVSID
jgi:hypothetical protein